MTIDQAINTAIQHHSAGRLREAEAIYRQVLSIQPEHPDALHHLGLISAQTGQMDLAVELIRKAIAVSPTTASFHSNLGQVLLTAGRYDEAIAACKSAIQLDANHPAANANLGEALRCVGRVDEAMAVLKRILNLKPSFVIAHNNLGKACWDWKLLDEASAAYQVAIRLAPQFAEAHYNLGNVRRDQGLIDEAMACYRKALELEPDLPYAHDNILFTMHYSPKYDARAIFEAHHSWNQLEPRRFRTLIPPHANDHSENRRLRIGYVSPDLRQSPIGRFMLPLLEHHDRGRFDIVCFSDVRSPDAFTERLRAYASEWHDTSRLRDDQLAELIHQSRIDILVDLSMHSGRNRLVVFARKPAPIQLTYLAYCSTTGLDTIDYRFSDPYLDPSEASDEFYSERTIRLPRTYWCYEPVSDLPQVAPPPFKSDGRITFGCLNNLSKVGPDALKLWCRLLRETPDADLVLHAYDGSHRQRINDLLLTEQVDPERLRFVGYQATPDYAQVYDSIDIALDPFPYNGGTTTCDALWMGVPVVTLAGSTGVGRAGVSLLSNVGLPELIGQTQDDYVRIAAELARDRIRLADLRSTLRQRMQGSPLMDAATFATDVESAYSQMWKRWCTGL